MSEKPRLDTARLQKIAQAYWESAALMAAVELEIFTAIAHGHDTVPAAAKAVGISERNAEKIAVFPRSVLIAETAAKERPPSDSTAPSFSTSARA